MPLAKYGTKSSAETRRMLAQSHDRSELKALKAAHACRSVGTNLSHLLNSFRTPQSNRPHISIN